MKDVESYNILSHVQSYEGKERYQSQHVYKSRAGENLLTINKERDVHNKATGFHHKIFRFIEDKGILDPFITQLNFL